MRRRGLPLVVVLVSSAAFAGTALAAFPQTPPNDPGYAPAEQGGLFTCLGRSANAEQYYLYSFIPRCARRAHDPEGASGMSVDRAWREFTTGNGSTVIAYIEGGINWRNQPAELANRVFLNKGELPKPTTPKDDGVLNAQDYADTKDTNGNGIVDPEDIIVRFSNGRDDDHNGYRDDISGWDFYDHQNDPATVDSTYDHANGQMRQAAAETNNGIGEAGICPKCMVMPIKAGAEALDRTDDLAQAWMYAADMRADVIVSVTADLGYSSFMEQAVRYAWRRGSVMVEASNDFDSTDHQGGMFHPFVLPGNGMVADSQMGAGDNPSVNLLTTNYRARSGYTSWGTHNVFTAATAGGTTSEATPTVGGVVALVRAYGKEAAARGLIRRPLTNDEAIQVLRATASDVNDPRSNWPSGPGWDLQFGYGRPNAYRAMQAVRAGDIPPQGWISKPDWYSLYDPTHTRKVRVTGHVSAPRARRYTWQLQYAPGAEPSDGSFITAGRGRGSRPRSGRLGTVDLNRIPASFWRAPFRLSKQKWLETNEQYTVTLRLRVFDAKGRVAEDRRTIAVHHDPSLLRRFPRKIGAGGESQPVLADLQGRGHLAAVFGDSDGLVHAVDGRTGRELPGWPARTRRTKVARRHKGVNPGREPVVAGVAVGDLGGNGRLDVVATSTTGRIYAWGPRGRRLRGWPKVLRSGVRRPPIPRPSEPFTRLPIQGASAPPVLADLNRDGKLDVLQAAWDGHVYAWHGNGRAVAGWPIDPSLPAGYEPGGGRRVVNDQKIDLPPAIAQLDGDPAPEVVVKAQDNEVPGAGLQVGGASHLHAYNADGSPVPGWPVTADAIVIYYGSAQEFITEGVSGPAAGDVDGDGRDEVTLAPGIFSPTYLFRPDGSQARVYGPLPENPFGTQGPGTGPPPGASLATDAPVNFTTSGAFGRFLPGARLGYAQPSSGGATTATALLLPGSGTPIGSYMAAWDAADGTSGPGFPARAQGLDFLGAPAIADVSGDGVPDLIEGGDSSALHAYVQGGGQAPGFPKFQPGWILWGPSVGDLDGDGRTDVVAATREGYLMAWRTTGKPSGDEWWSYRHDERNSGRYGADTRPPGAIRRAEVTRGGRELSFVAPGDDWYAGKVDHYELVTGRRCKGRVTVHRLPAGAGAGGRQSLQLPQGRPALRVFAVDEAGNRGPSARLARACRR